VDIYQRSKNGNRAFVIGAKRVAETGVGALKHLGRLVKALQLEKTSPVVRLEDRGVPVSFGQVRLGDLHGLGDEGEGVFEPLLVAIQGCEVVHGPEGAWVARSRHALANFERFLKEQSCRLITLVLG
jgi:hypothetical protein